MAEISRKPVSDFDAAVRLLSGGTNVAIYNDLGMPSIYVRRDKGAISDVIDGGPDTTHYAFKVNGVEIPAFYMGKYLATVYKGRALSLPLQNPVTGWVEAVDVGSNSDIVTFDDMVTFDNAKIWCEANGAGFHLPTIAEYAWLALLSRKNDTMPHGNDYKGSDFSYRYEKGVCSESDERNGKTLTGSGPATWNDNWKPDGICDLHGNVTEWQGGYRMVDGELQIFADNDAAMQYEQNPESTRWKAILQNGTLVEPGTDGTLKWDYIKDPGTVTAGIPYRLNTKLTFQQTVDAPYGCVDFESLTSADGVLVPDRLKALALMPDGTGASYGGAQAEMRNCGENFVYRGGNYLRLGSGGVFATEYCPRLSCGNHLGFRPAFIPGI